MSIFSKVLFLIAFALSSVMTAAYAGDEPPNDEPVPFVCDGEAYTVRNTPGEFYLIDQSVSPFDFTQIKLGPLTGPFGLGGAIVPIQANNIGYRVVDNLIYGVALKATTPNTFNLNLGLIKIDSAGNVFPVPTFPDISALPQRFLAGDIDPNSDKMYLNDYPTTSPMQVVDLATLIVTPMVIGPTAGVNVADWAVNPVDGNLYGADGLCNPVAQIYKLNVNTGAITALATPVGGLGLPCSNSGNAQYYGGSWFNAQGKLFVYRNNDFIYEVDITQSPPVVDSIQQGKAGSSQFNDATACAAGVPIVDKFYTYTNNNWEPRCVSYEDILNEFNEVIGQECTEYRLPNINLDDDIFADNLPQNEDDAFVLLGKELNDKTVINPGQYFAVSNIQIPIEQDVTVLEDFADCLDIGMVNPFSVPGGVQVVLITKDGDVIDISGQLANGIGGSIELYNDHVIVHAENLPAESVLRVMVKFQPNDDLDMIGLMCTNREVILDENGEETNVLDTADLVVEEK